jgi:hypothetical protein
MTGWLAVGIGHDLDPESRQDYDGVDHGQTLRPKPCHRTAAAGGSIARKLLEQYHRDANRCHLGVMKLPGNR